MDFLLGGTRAPHFSSARPFVAPFVFGVFFKSHLLLHKTLQRIRFSPLGLHAETKDRIPKSGYPLFFSRDSYALCPCDFGCALHLTPSFRLLLLFQILIFFFTPDFHVSSLKTVKPHITVQLLALSFRKSVATAESSGLLGMCEIRFVALCDLFRLTFLFVLFTHAKVAT